MHRTEEQRELIRCFFSLIQCSNSLGTISTILQEQSDGHAVGTGST